jgi:membrane protein YdbS with pleckstrin-like domain
MNDRGRPQRPHRLRTRTLNFLVLPIVLNLANVDKAHLFLYFLNGMPNSRNTARACSFVRAVVATVIVIPLILSTLS